MIDLSAIHWSVPMELGVTLTERPWPGGGEVKVIRFYIGNDTIQVWPADPEVLERFGQKIIQAAMELKKDEEQKQTV